MVYSEIRILPILWTMMYCEIRMKGLIHAWWIVVEAYRQLSAGRYEDWLFVVVLIIIQTGLYIHCSMLIVRPQFMPA